MLVQVKSHANIYLTTHQWSPNASGVEGCIVWCCVAQNWVVLLVSCNVLTAEVDVPLLDFAGNLSEEHWVDWRVFALFNIARLSRYATLAIELCCNVECPLAHTGSILDVKQCLIATYEWSLNKLLCAIGASNGILAICIAECGKNVQSLGWSPACKY